MATISASELADLLVSTGQSHHAAYSESDGVDPEWASWYAPHIQALLGDRLGRDITRSELIYLLIKADREQTRAAHATPWAEFYAKVLLAG